MPFPNEITPNTSNKHVFIFNDTTTSFLYLCVGDVSVNTSQNITSRSQLPANTRCAKLIDDAATGINSICPSAGSIYPEKSYATYDSNSRTLTVYESTVTNNASCSYTTTIKTVPIPEYSPPRVKLFMFYKNCPWWYGRLRIVDSNTYNTVSVNNISADYLCMNYSQSPQSFNDGGNGTRFEETSFNIPRVSRYGSGYQPGILMVVWENQSALQTLDFSFSCPVSERHIGFMGVYHQMSNIPGITVIEQSFSIVDMGNNNTVYISPPSSAKLFPVVSDPPSPWQSIKGWCTISAHISPRRFYYSFNHNPDTPTYTYTIPVFAEWW